MTDAHTIMAAMEAARRWALRPEAIQRAAQAMFDAEWGSSEVWPRLTRGEPVRKLFIERARIAITTALEDA